MDFDGNGQRVGGPIHGGPHEGVRIEQGRDDGVLFRGAERFQKLELPCVLEDVSLITLLLKMEC